MLPLLLLSLVGAGPFDLPTAAAEVRVPSSHPAIASAGATTVVIWEDGRPEALLGPVERTPTPLPHFWWSRLQPDGGSQPRAGEPGCFGGEGSRFAVTADPASGVAYVGWLVRRTTNTAALQVGVLEPSGTLICNANTNGQPTAWPSDLLTLGWTGSQFFAGWRGMSVGYMTWCSSSGVCGSVGMLPGVRPSPDVSFGAGAQSGAALFRGVGTGSPWSAPRSEGMTGGSIGPDPTQLISSSSTPSRGPLPTARAAASGRSSRTPARRARARFGPFSSSPFRSRVPPSPFSRAAPAWPWRSGQTAGPAPGRCPL